MIEIWTKLRSLVDCSRILVGWQALIFNNIFFQCLSSLVPRYLIAGEVRRHRWRAAAAKLPVPGTRCSRNPGVVIGTRERKPSAGLGNWNQEQVTCVCIPRQRWFPAAKSQQNSNMANMSRIHGIPLPEDLPFNWLAGWLAAWTNLSLTGLGALNEIHFLPLGFALFSPLLAHIFLHLTFQQFSPFSPHQAPRCVINFESTHTCSRTSFPVFATVRDSRSSRLLAPDGSWYQLRTALESAAEGSMPPMGATQSGNVCLISTFSSKNVLIYKRVRFAARCSQLAAQKDMHPHAPKTITNV